jgi:HSP20 family protein
MANIVRHQPRDVLSLREAMDQLFEQSFFSPLAGDGGWVQPSGWVQMGVPAVDVVETAEEVIVTASVPGIKADDLKISLTGDVLQLSAQTSEESERKDARYHLRERRSSAFSRSIGLPAPVESDKAQADFENGVLTLKLPKAQGARPRTITVKAKK